MVSMMDSSKLMRTMRTVKDTDVKKKNPVLLNKYYRAREESAIKLAEEQGYFRRLTEAFLMSKFGPGLEQFVDTDSVIPRRKKQPDLLFIEWVNLNAMHIRHLGDLPLCKNLCICVLSDNYLDNIEPLSECPNLVKLDLHRNQISQLPCSSFWATMKHLQILYLHDNPIGTFRMVTPLSVCERLVALTLHDTPVNLRPNYRHHIVNSICSLKVLDHYMVSDDEIIEDMTFKGRFAALHPSLHMPLPCSNSDMNYETELVQTLELLRDINEKEAHTSPVLIIQKFVAGYLTRKALRSNSFYARLAKHKKTPDVIPTKIPFPDSLYNAVDLPTSGAQRSSGNRPQLVINLSKLHHDTLTYLDHDNVTIEKFMNESTSRRLKKIPAVPVNKRRRKRVEKIKKLIVFNVSDFFGPVVNTRPGSENFDDEAIPFTKYRLQGKRHQMCANDRTAEMLYTTRDIANDIRSEEEFFHELAAKAPRPPRQFNKVTTISERMFARSQRDMNLTPLLAVQKAYDERARAQRRADRVERCGVLRNERSRALDKLNEFRDEHRRHLAVETQRRRWYIQDALEANSTNKFVRLDKQRDGRCRSSHIARTHTHEKSFGRDFMSQNASVSTALQHHDYAHHVEQQTETQFKGTQERRVSARDNHETVKQYMEHRATTLLHEGQDSRAVLSSRMLEDTNDRMMLARARVERLKNTTKSVEEYHRAQTMHMQLNGGRRHT